MRNSMLLFVLATVTSLQVPRSEDFLYKKRRELPKPSVTSYHHDNKAGLLGPPIPLPEECLNTTGSEQKGMLTIQQSKTMGQHAPQKTGAQGSSVPQKVSSSGSSSKTGESKAPSQASAAQSTLVSATETSPVGAPAATPLGAPAATPLGAPAATPLGPPAATPLGTPMAVPVGTPMATPLGTPMATASGGIPQPQQVRKAQSVGNPITAGEQQPNVQLQGKLSIVEHGVQSAVQSAQIAANQLKTLSGAAKTAQNAVAEAEATAQSAERELQEKTQLVEAAKQRVEELLKELAAARTELANSKEAALKASPAKRNRYIRGDESSVQVVSDVMMTAKQRVQQLLDQLSVARINLKNSKIDYERASMEARIAKEKLKRGRCALLEQPFA